MEDIEIFDGVRDRLIEAGRDELLEHGMRDFSLRRVATSAQVSCAAPYRHFKSKDELIFAIVEHIKEDWLLLTGQISDVFEGDSVARVVELLSTAVRFWIANGSLRSVLTSGGWDRGGFSGFDAPILSAVEDYARERWLSCDEAELLSYTALSLLYGTVMLITSGADADLTIANMRRKLLGEFPRAGKI